MFAYAFTNYAESKFSLLIYGFENNKFVSSNKKTILNNANRFCKIEDKKNKQYEIKEIFSYVKPKEIEKMKESLYQYIIPLLLINLFKSNDSFLL